jgi:hypothetical protein
MALRPQQSPSAATVPAAPPAQATPVPPAPLPTPPVVPDIAALKINVPVSPPAATANIGRDQEAQLLRRVRELEEEVRMMRVENEKHVSGVPTGGIAL